jgi:hypothetical protein
MADLPMAQLRKRLAGQGDLAHTRPGIAFAEPRVAEFGKAVRNAGRRWFGRFRRASAE